MRWWEFAVGAEMQIKQIKTKYIKKGVFIETKTIVGTLLIISITGCVTLKESLFLGASTGAVVGGIAGAQAAGDHSENIIKGAVLGAVAIGLVSYTIHNGLEKRDASVRRETLMNLEHFEVMGFEGVRSEASQNATSSKCYTTQEVDGKLVSIPCHLVNGRHDLEGRD